MPKSYSEDLRERVVEAVEAGASRHAAAAHFKVSVSSAIRWVQRWRSSGEIAARPRGGSTSPLEDHEAALLAGAERATGPVIGRILRGAEGAQDHHQPGVGLAVFQPARGQL
jgi:transposase